MIGPQERSSYRASLYRARQGVCGRVRAHTRTRTRYRYVKAIGFPAVQIGVHVVFFLYKWKLHFN